MKKWMLFFSLFFIVSLPGSALAESTPELMFLLQVSTTAAPTITSLNPSSTAAGGPSFSLAVSGTNFINGSTIRWNNSPRPTALVSSSQLIAFIPASDIALPGTAIITVIHPDGTTSNGTTFTTIETALLFAQIAEGKAPGGLFKTVLVVLNPNDKPVAVSVEFFISPSGAPFPIDIGIGSLISAFEVTVSGKSQVQITTAGTRPTADPGWARVRSKDRFGALVIYQFFNDSGAFVTEAGVAPSPLAQNFIATAELRDGFESGLALVNPAESGIAAATLRLRDQFGNVLGTASIQLGPRQHTAQFLHELFPAALIPVGFEGTIEVNTNLALAATTLRTLRGLQTSTLPIVVVP